MRARVRHFNPANAGCAVALDARFISGLADNASVATWSSRTGGSYGATASGTAQPTYKASSINGRPAVQFDGTSDVMDFDAGVAGMSNNAAGGLIISVSVVDNAAADASQFVVSISSGTSTSNARFRQVIQASGVSQSNATGRRLDTDTLAGNTAAAGATTSPCVLQTIADWANNSLASRTNGGTQTTATFSSGGGNTSATNSLSTKLGAQNATTSRLSGRIAAVCMAAQTLATPLRIRIRNHYGFSFRIATA